MKRRLGLTKKEWEQMITERFYELLDQLPDTVIDATNEVVSMADPTIHDVRRAAASGRVSNVVGILCRRAPGI